MDSKLIQYQKFWDGNELSDGIYNVNLYSVEIFESKKDGSLNLIWKFYYGEQEIKKFDKLGNSRDYMIRKDIEYISNSSIENIIDLPKILPLIKNIPCEIEIKTNGKYKNINFVKKKEEVIEKKSSEFNFNDPLPDLPSFDNFPG